jgi:hypothetical protein
VEEWRREKLKIRIYFRKIYFRSSEWVGVLNPRNPGSGCKPEMMG